MIDFDLSRRKVLKIIGIGTIVTVAGLLFLEADGKLFPLGKSDTTSTTRTTSSTSNSTSRSGVSTTTSASASTTKTSQSSSTSTSSQIPASGKFIEIKAFENNSYLAAPLYSANELLSLVQEIHGAVGNYNITKFIRAQCRANIDPTTTFSDWSGDMNSFFSAIQQACGGDIIPDVDMDIYFCQNDCGNTCGPDYFFDNASGLQKIAALQGGMAHLEAWDAYYSHDTPSQSDIATFFQTMQGQGWGSFMSQVDDGGVGGGGNGGALKQPDYGYASYVRVGLFDIQSTSPYLIPMQNLIDSTWQNEPYLKGVLSAIESQQQNGQYGGYDFAIQQFTEGLTPGEQEAGLTAWAAGQASNNYTVVYPVLVTLGGNDASGKGTWDAKGAGALSTIEGLMLQYNS